MSRNQVGSLLHRAEMEKLKTAKTGLDVSNYYMSELQLRELAEHVKDQDDFKTAKSCHVCYEHRDRIEFNVAMFSARGSTNPPICTSTGAPLSGGLLKQAKACYRVYKVQGGLDNGANITNSYMCEGYLMYALGQGGLLSNVNAAAAPSSDLKTTRGVLIAIQFKELPMGACYKSKGSGIKDRQKSWTHGHLGARLLASETSNCTRIAICVRETY